MEKQTFMQNFIKKLNPSRILVLGFLIVIFVGMLLLLLPMASADGKSIPFVDALFTATSAVCVTGLVVVNTFEHWSAFGKVVIICLIQIGGLGFITILTMFAIARKKKLTFKEKVIAQEALNQNNLLGLINLVRSAIIGACIVEAIGAALITARLAFDMGFGRAVAVGVFQSVSSFCNAGFDIIGPNGLEHYAADFFINMFFIALIVIGGLGFTVWLDIIAFFKRLRLGFSVAQSANKMSLHCKITLTTTAALVFGGAFAFFALEYSNLGTIGGMSLGGKLIASLMQSVTMRTAGYAGIPQGELNYASKFLGIILMFIGGSPSGTAGGIKTATFAALIIAVISITRGNEKVVIWGKTLPFSTLQKALAVFLINGALLVCGTMILSVTEKDLLATYDFIDIFYEVASALGTTGVTAGVTANLSTIGKLIICALMFIGRLGPISVVIALTKKMSSNSAIVEYPEENILVG